MFNEAPRIMVDFLSNEEAIFTHFLKAMTPMDIESLRQNRKRSGNMQTRSQCAKESRERNKKYVQLIDCSYIFESFSESSLSMRHVLQLPEKVKGAFYSFHELIIITSSNQRL